jgi:predicted RNA-binding protein with PUA-like domain
MNRWLVKSDPDEYAAADLERDKTTRWTGVSNATAQQHLRSMAAGDEIFLYHTGAQRAVVATGRVAAGPRLDPADKAGKLVLVELTFDRWLKTPVTLEAIKAQPAFASFDLVRISRLSVMPVSADHWRRILKLAGG